MSGTKNSATKKIGVNMQVVYIVKSFGPQGYLNLKAFAELRIRNSPISPTLDKTASACGALFKIITNPLSMYNNSEGFYSIPCRKNHE